MEKITFGALPVRTIPTKIRPSVTQLSRSEKLKRTIKKGMTIDKLPETGFIVGMMLPIPFTSVILPSIGIAIKYSYKSFKWLKSKQVKQNRLDKIV